MTTSISLIRRSIDTPPIKSTFRSPVTTSTASEVSTIAPRRRITRRTTLIRIVGSSSSTRTGVSAKVLNSELPSATITAATWRKSTNRRRLNIKHGFYRYRQLGRKLASLPALQLPPIGHEVSGHARAEAERGSARCPIVVEHQRVARKAHLARGHREKRSRRHRERDPASARRFDHANIYQRASGAAAALGIETQAAAHSFNL